MSTLTGPARPLSQQRLAALTWSSQRKAINAWHSLTHGVRGEAVAWYPNARMEAAAMCPSDPSRAAQVIAILSPRCRWQHNLHDAHKVFAGEPITYAFRYRGEQALKVAAGNATLDDTVSPRARKVRAFACNIAHGPACTHGGCVTLDAWMARFFDLNPKMFERVGVYRAVANGVRNAATQLGIHPFELQAALWLHVRNTKEAA